MKENFVFEEFAGESNLLHAMALKEMNLTAQFCNTEPLHFSRVLLKPSVSVTFNGNDVDFVTELTAMLSNFDRKAAPASD